MSTGSKDGAFLADAKLAGGIDSNGNEHPLNCDTTGTLMVTGVVDVLPGSIFEITGEVEIKNDSGNPIPVTGTVTTTPSGTQTVAISQTGTDNDVNVTGTVSVSNFPATQPISGSVSVSNFPASVEISNDVGNPIPVSGSLTTTPSGTQDVNIVSTVALPVTDNGGSLTVDGTFFQATQPVSGTVAVSNFPATQPVSGPLTDTQLRASPVSVSGTITSSKAQYSRSDVYTVASNGGTIDCTVSAAQIFTLQVKSAGGVASAWDVRLEGSLDNVSFTQILQHTNVTGDGNLVFGNLNSPCLYFRSRLASVTLGLATSITASILGL